MVLTNCGQASHSVSSKMAMTGKAKELATRAGLPDDAERWFVGHNITEVNDVAILAKTEDLVDENIVAVMKAESVSSANKIGQKLGITKFWSACRESYENENERLVVGLVAVSEASVCRSASGSRCSSPSAVRTLELR